MRLSSLLSLVAVFLAVIVTVGAATFTYVNVRQVVAESPIELPPPPQAGNAPTAAPLLTSTQTNAASLSTGTPAAGQNPGATPTVATWSDPSRVTILLLGIDQRKGEKGPFRTDTMMILSIDPVRKTAAMLSIPRDIYINIPYYNRADRINNANVIGDTLIKDFPGGGPALAVKTVQSLLGIPIQRYVLINFDVFTTASDAIAPIRVCPDSAIHDDQYPDGSYGYITVDFPAGCQDLDSTKLLQYARVRHNAGDDFGRAKRQQEVIRAVRDKVFTMGGVSSLLGKASAIWASIKDNIKTDMTFQEMINLAQLAQDIPKDNIRSAVMTDKDGYLIPATLPSGEQVFTPWYENIHDLVEKLFDAAPVSTTNAQASAEGAAIVVSNGAGVDGLAKATADRLKSQGFNIVDAKNSDQPGGYGQSVIKVYTEKIKTAQYLADVLGLPRTVITREKDGPPGVDIELIVGKDLAPNNR
jgi:polyisoprenyl-teichoic acid--peptidoglycan teichoic acid transferase